MGRSCRDRVSPRQMLTEFVLESGPSTSTRFSRPVLWRRPTKPVSVGCVISLLSVGVDFVIYLCLALVCHPPDLFSCCVGRLSRSACICIPLKWCNQHRKVMQMTELARPICWLFGEVLVVQLPPKNCTASISPERGRR